MIGLACTKKESRTPHPSRILTSEQTSGPTLSTCQTNQELIMSDTSQQREESMMCSKLATQLWCDSYHNNHHSRLSFPPPPFCLACLKIRWLLFISKTLQRGRRVSTGNTKNGNGRVGKNDLVGHSGHIVAS